MPPDPFVRLEGIAGVAEAVASARAAVDKLLSHRILRRRSAELSAESSLRGARASAALDGCDVALEQLRGAMTAGTALPARMTGALNVAASLGELRPTFERAPRQVLARLHVLAAGADADADAAHLGRPRSTAAGGVGEPAEPSPIEDPLGLGTAPPVIEMGARLGGLLETLVRPTKASALVVAAVVHAEVLALRPFGTADGVVARAASRLVLVGRGLDPKAVTQPEVGHLETGGYAAAAAAYVAGDPGVFIVHCCEAVALGAREGLALAEALQRGA